MAPKQKTIAELGTIEHNGNGWRVKLKIGQQQCNGPTHPTHVAAQADLDAVRKSTSREEMLQFFAKMRRSSASRIEDMLQDARSGTADEKDAPRPPSGIRDNSSSWVAALKASAKDARKRKNGRPRLQQSKTRVINDDDAVARQQAEPIAAANRKAEEWDGVLNCRREFCNTGEESDAEKDFPFVGIAAPDSQSSSDDASERVTPRLPNGSRPKSNSWVAAPKASAKDVRKKKNALPRLQQSETAVIDDDDAVALQQAEAAYADAIATWELMDIDLLGEECAEAREPGEWDSLIETIPIDVRKAMGIPTGGEGLAAFLNEETTKIQNAIFQVLQAARGVHMNSVLAALAVPTSKIALDAAMRDGGLLRMLLSLIHI